MNNPKYVVATKIYMGLPMEEQLNDTIVEFESKVGEVENWRLQSIVGPLITLRGPDTFVGYFQGENPAEQIC